MKENKELEIIVRNETMLKQTLSPRKECLYTGSTWNHDPSFPFLSKYTFIAFRSNLAGEFFITVRYLSDLTCNNCKQTSLVEFGRKNRCVNSLLIVNSNLD